MSTDGQTLQQAACLLHVHEYANKSAYRVYNEKVWNVKQGNPGLCSTRAKNDSGWTITKINGLCELFWERHYSACDHAVRGQSIEFKGKIFPSPKISISLFLPASLFQLFCSGVRVSLKSAAIKWIFPLIHLLTALSRRIPHFQKAFFIYFLHSSEAIVAWQAHRK